MFTGIQLFLSLLGIPPYSSFECSEFQFNGFVALGDTIYEEHNKKSDKCRFVTHAVTFN